MSLAAALYGHLHYHHSDKPIEWKNGYHACLTAYRWPPFQGNREYCEGWASAWLCVWDEMRERGADMNTRRLWTRYYAWAQTQGISS